MSDSEDLTINALSSIHKNEGSKIIDQCKSTELVWVQGPMRVISHHRGADSKAAHSLESPKQSLSIVVPTALTVDYLVTELIPHCAGRLLGSTSPGGTDYRNRRQIVRHGEIAVPVLSPDTLI
jgi:hypothetical protein